MKRIISIILVLFILTSLCALCFAEREAEEKEIFTSGDFEYTIENNEAIIDKYRGNANSLKIPDEIDGYPVTEIDDYAFADCRYLISITIPDSVVNIGDDSFTFCYNLTDIIVSPEHPVLEIIDGGLYRKTDKTFIIYPRTLENTEFAIPYGIADISNSAFFGCQNLVSITIPDTVISIGNEAFRYCHELTSITIPDSVTFIGEYAFAACSSMTSIVIPGSVTSIGNGAFSACKSLTSVTIPDNVTSIGSAVFSDCYSLTSIIIPDSVTSIDEFAFFNCGHLASITIPDSVTFIGNCAFAECSSMTSVTIPGSVTSIGVKAFANCPLLTLTVEKDSYAQQYAEENGLKYIYSDTSKKG